MLKVMYILQLLILCRCFKNNDLNLYFRYKGCKYPVHIFRFSAVDYMSHQACLSMPLTHNVYNESTHIHTKWLAEAKGGGVSRKLFLISIRFNYKLSLSSSKLDVFVLKYQKIIL